QRLRQAVESVRLYLRRRARSTMKCAQEVFNGFPALTLLPDDRVDFQPDQQTFVIKIDTPPFRIPVASSVVQKLRSDCSIRKGPPHAAGAVVERSAAQGEVLKILLRSIEAGARREDPSEIFR